MWRSISDCARRRAEAERDLYIHAEALRAGELKHGPLALIDADMPVIVVAPKRNELLEKLKSNIEEVRAGVAVSCTFADQDAGFCE